MLRRPPRSTRTDTLFPYPTLFRSLESKLDRQPRVACPRGNVSQNELWTLLIKPARTGVLGWSGSPTWSLCQRSEEHTSELQSLMRISYAVFCLKKKIQQYHQKAEARL